MTGAGGFVGQHLVAHLRTCGDDVTLTDRFVGVDDTRAVDICDFGAFRDLAADIEPEVVYHLAGDADVGGSWDHPLDTFHANAVGTLTVLTACRSAAPKARVLCVSSADVYGRVPQDELPITELRPMAPVSPYAASKVAADLVALQAWLGHGQETVRVRAFNHLGPGQSNRFVAPAVAERIVAAERSGQQAVAAGNLTPRRDVTDVRDVVRAYRLLAERGSPGEAYNVCSGTDVSVGELIDQLIALSDADLRVEPDPTLQRPVDTPVLRGDHSKLTAATGWLPEIPLVQTLTDLLHDYRSRAPAAPTPRTEERESA